MLTKNINFKNFSIKSNTLSVKRNFKLLLRQNLELISSLKDSYKYNYKKKLISLKYIKSLIFEILLFTGLRSDLWVITLK